MISLLSVRLHNIKKETIVAACDIELLGKKFIDGQTKIEVYPAFYGGAEIEEGELASYLMKATIANLVGIRAVSIATELGYVSMDRILYISGIPHAQFALLV
ncbi:MAG: DUF424 family protein [Methanomassiliicoccales archaeon]